MRVQIYTQNCRARERVSKRVSNGENKSGREREREREKREREQERKREGQEKKRKRSIVRVEA